MSLPCAPKWQIRHDWQKTAKLTEVVPARGVGTVCLPGSVAAGRVPTEVASVARGIAVAGVFHGVFATLQAVVERKLVGGRAHPYMGQEEECVVRTNVWIFSKRGDRKSVV